MRTVKVIVHVYNKELTYAAQSFIRAEVVARNGVSQEVRQAYHAPKDEEVQLGIVFLCWSTGERVPSFYIPLDALRNALEKINLYLL